MFQYNHEIWAWKTFGNWEILNPKRICLLIVIVTINIYFDDFCVITIITLSSWYFKAIWLQTMGALSEDDRKYINPMFAITIHTGFEFWKYQNFNGVLMVLMGRIFFRGKLLVKFSNSLLENCCSCVDLFENQYFNIVLSH